MLNMAVLWLFWLTVCFLAVFGLALLQDFYCILTVFASFFMQ
jgi:hypothetical protein